MNERIRKLYNQSLEQKYRYGGSGAAPGEMYSNYITVLNEEKFAELIVQQCAGIITSQDVDPAFKNRMAWAIKEHFGVE